MKSLNQKGFTLVELLAVIVVLAIVMIIAMPNVFKAMNDAREGAFRSYAKKIVGAAQGQFASDELLNKLPTATTADAAGLTANKINATNCKVNGVAQSECYCYPLPALGFNSGNIYSGYVIVALDTNRAPSYYITLTDKNQSFKDVTLSGIDSQAVTGPQTTYNKCGASLAYTTPTP